MDAVAQYTHQVVIKYGLLRLDQYNEQNSCYSAVLHRRQ